MRSVPKNANSRPACGRTDDAQGHRLVRADLLDRVEPMPAQALTIQATQIVGIDIEQRFKLVDAISKRLRVVTNKLRKHGRPLGRYVGFLGLS